MNCITLVAVLRIDHKRTKAEVRGVDRIAVFKQEMMMVWTRMVASGGSEK